MWPHGCPPGSAGQSRRGVPFAGPSRPLMRADSVCAHCARVTAGRCRLGARLLVGRVAVLCAPARRRCAMQATKVLNMVKLFDKPIRVTHSAQDRGQELGVGANIFVGNIGDEVDEKLLYDTFGAFGVVVGAPKVARDAETGNPRGFGFVSFDSFEASDAAIEAMDGQFLAGRAINVTYAFKKDSRGERHGTPAERMLAAARKQGKKDSRPNMHFAAGPAQPVGLGLPPPSAPAAVVPPAGMPPPPQMPAQMQPPAGMPMQPPPQQQPPGWMPPPPMAAGSAGRGLPPGMPPPPGAWGAPPLGMRPPGGQLPPMQGPPPGMPPPPAGPWGAAPVGVPPGMPPAAGHMPPPPR